MLKISIDIKRMYFRLIDMCACSPVPQKASSLREKNHEGEKPPVVVSYE